MSSTLEIAEPILKINEPITVKTSIDDYEFF